jgi:hypothetical protein
MIHSISSRLYGNVLDNKGLHLYLLPLCRTMTEQRRGSSRVLGGAHAQSMTHSTLIEFERASAPELSERRDHTWCEKVFRGSSEARFSPATKQLLSFNAHRVASARQCSTSLCTMQRPPNKAIFEKDFNDDEPRRSSQSPTVRGFRSCAQTCSKQAIN